ncbi:hypothetical protein E6Q11_06665 [Candidatus Dojkabacteria bacterium]|uniref:Uncharacterized protein n=1 Tax=Candidatus Dojkabacteria bacterium TaxID=2099670 RepID=A0A5C7J2S9_9BACT|nr:MAG: hypothetical protein E6Q11_06665 [Candidatus Dojkabacteria bacterium]
MMIKNINGNYIEYAVIRSKEQLTQLESKRNFVCSCMLEDVFKNAPKSANVSFIKKSSDYSDDELQLIGKIASSIQTSMGFTCLDEIPNYLYVIHSLTDGDKFFLQLMGIDIQSNVFRFNPIQEDKVFAIENAKYNLFVARLGFIWEAKNGRMSRSPSSPMMKQLANIKKQLADFLVEPCIPKEAKNLLTAYKEQVENPSVKHNFVAIEDTLMFLTHLYFKME